MSVEHGAEEAAREPARERGRRPERGVAALHLRRLARGVMDFAFPPHLLDAQGVDAGGAQASGLSAAAWSNVTFLEAPWCDGCGTPFDHDQGAGALCPGCSRGTRRPFARARAACLYDEASRDLILQFKHADRTELGRLFALWVARAARELIAECDAVAPVPLHRARMLGRRYNQAAEIARPLARSARLAYLPDALRRTRQGTQGGRSASGRKRAVAGAFAVPPSLRSRVEGRRILLIDDVMTTGATAEACARALLKAGAAAVDVAVVARVRER